MLKTHLLSKQLLNGELRLFLWGKEETTFHLRQTNHKVRKKLRQEEGKPNKGFVWKHQNIYVQKNWREKQFQMGIKFIKFRGCPKHMKIGPNPPRF